jgi:RNA polymerase sigma-70 factor (ECF subfamily)
LQNVILVIGEHLDLKPNNIDLVIRKISQNDDEKSFRDLFDIYHGKLIDMAKFYVNEDYAAKEIVSEVFIKIWKGRGGLENVNNIGAYLFIATKRQALNYIRNDKKRIQYSLEEREVNTYVEINSPEKLLISKEFEEVLNKAIQELPSKCRLVYSLVKDDGMKYLEVSEVLNISIKTVEMHVGKALKRIKEALHNYQNNF